jgi:lipoprotein-releasing system permease protein
MPFAGVVIGGKTWQHAPRCQSKEGEWLSRTSSRLLSPRAWGVYLMINRGIDENDARRTSAFFAALQVERNVMFLILTLIVLVAALNIVSGLIMLVKDKGSDIAILRTIGASRGAIMRVFLIAGAAIGVIGTLTGLLVGMLVCMNIESIRQFLSWLTNTELFPPKLYFLSKLPAEVDFGETAAVVAMALTLSFLATLYPSWRAARLDPVDALRYG